MSRGERSPLEDLFADSAVPAQPLDIQIDINSVNEITSGTSSTSAASKKSLMDTTNVTGASPTASALSEHSQTLSTHTSQREKVNMSRDTVLQHESSNSPSLQALPDANIESPHTAIEIAGCETETSLLAGDGTDEKSLAMDDFARDVCKLSSGVEQMASLCLLFGTQRDSHEHRVRMNALADSIKERIEMATQRLHIVKSCSVLLPHERERLSRLSVDFEAQIAQFQRLQTRMIVSSQEFVTDLSARIKLPAASPTSARPSHEMHVDEGEHAENEGDALLSISASHTVQTQMLGEIEFNQALIAEREHAIREIEATMAEVHELFVDIGLVAHEQQGMLDNIEANIEASAIRTRAGVREIRLARDRQMRRRRRQILCMLLAAFIVLVLTIVLIASL